MENLYKENRMWGMSRFWAVVGIPFQLFLKVFEYLFIA